VAVLQEWTLPPISLSAVYPIGRLASSKARAFVSFVEAYLKGRDPAPCGAAQG
jgi:DNA-binding transcriptional LysR family regulator